MVEFKSWLSAFQSVAKGSGSIWMALHNAIAIKSVTTTLDDRSVVLGDIFLFASSQQQLAAISAMRSCKSSTAHVRLLPNGIGAQIMSAHKPIKTNRSAERSLAGIWVRVQSMQIAKGPENSGPFGG